MDIRYYIVHLLAVTEDSFDLEAVKKMYNRTAALSGTDSYEDFFNEHNNELVRTYIDTAYMTPALYQTWFDKH